MSDLPRRSVTAGVYGAVVLLAVAAPPVIFWMLLAVAAAMGLRELLALRAGGPSLALGVVFFGGLACLGALRQLGPHGARVGTPADLPVWLLFTVLAVWAGDVVAYLVGATFGRRRIAPAISPGKTWEGTFAGFAAATLVALGADAAFDLGGTQTVILALGIGPAAFGGDLLESYVKRRAGVKDSGRLLPGHGGILDRLDSLTAAAAWVLLFGGLWGVLSGMMGR